MKATIFISAFALLFWGACSQPGESEEVEKSEFKVYGECSMCKSRIEEAALTEGVQSAEWDENTMILSVEYLPSKIEITTIHKNMAQVGHDTEFEKADDSVYNALQTCCKYDRPQAQDTHTN